MTAKLQIGDVCRSGHIVAGENVRHYTKKRKDGSRSELIACLECDRKAKRESVARSRAKPIKPEKLPFDRKEWYRQYRKEYRLRKQLEREQHTELVDMSIKDDKKANAPWVYLAPKDSAKAALDVLDAALETGRSKCFNNPGPYQDYEDDSPPNITEARALCEGCPFLVECGAYGRASRNRGVWGGIRIDENGKVFG